mmetsp:Transcript_118402/g.330251  ORF Transcript_118402/g.330251 Transcript_118402/m.330251 type:complete len:169 (-) Transcript_118402:412-918(-)
MRAPVCRCSGRRSRFLWTRLWALPALPQRLRFRRSLRSLLLHHARDWSASNLGRCLRIRRKLAEALNCWRLPWPRQGRQTRALQEPLTQRSGQSRSCHGSPNGHLQRLSAMELASPAKAVGPFENCLKRLQGWVCCGAARCCRRTSGSNSALGVTDAGGLSLRLTVAG